LAPSFIPFLKNIVRKTENRLSVEIVYGILDIFKDLFGWYSSNKQELNSPEGQNES
jgi:hypothetical protein